MTLVPALILAAIAAVILIEACDRLRMRILMDRRVAALNLSQDSCRCKRCAEQANSNNRKQTKIQHQPSPLMAG
jgi:hypothetical protein